MPNAALCFQKGRCIQHSSRGLSTILFQSTAFDEAGSMQVGHNSVELAMEWLIAHPEDPAAAGTGAGAAATAPAEGDEAQLAQALAASLKAGEPSEDVAVSPVCPMVPQPMLFFPTCSSLTLAPGVSSMWCLHHGTGVVLQKRLDAAAIFWSLSLHRSGALH